MLAGTENMSVCHFCPSLWTDKSGKLGYFLSISDGK